MPAPVVQALLRGLSPKREDRFDTLAELLAAIAPKPASGGGGLLVVASVVAALVAGAAGANLLEEAPADPCAAVRAEVDAAWTHRAGDDTMAHLDAAATAYQDALHGELTALCEGAPSRDAIASPLSCLRRSALSLRAVDQAVADEIELQPALEATMQLAHPQRCTDPARRASEPPLPVDRDRLERAQTIRDTLAAAKVDALLGREDRTKVAAEAALDDAAAIEDRVAEAQAYFLLGQVASRAGRGPEAEVAHRKAALAAERAGYDWLRAYAIIDHAGVLAQMLGRLDEADQQLATAAAIAEHLGHPADLVEVLQTMRGMVLYSRRQPEEAVVALKASIAATEARLGPDVFRLVRPINVLGASYMALGALDEGIAAFVRVRDMVESHYGRSHPLYARVLSNLGAAARDNDDLQSAATYLEEALARGIEAHGEEHPSVVIAMHNLADVYGEAGDPTRGLELARRALSVAERVHGPGSTELRWSLNTLASCEASAGNVDAALRALARAEQVIVAEWGEDAVQLIQTLELRAGIEQEAGRSSAHGETAARISAIAKLRDAELPPSAPDR